MLKSVEGLLHGKCEEGGAERYSRSYAYEGFVGTTSIYSCRIFLRACSLSAGLVL